MAVAFDASTSGSITTTASVSHTPVGTPRGVKVSVVIDDKNNTVSGITYGGVAMVQVAGSPSDEWVTNNTSVIVYFLGSGIPTGTQNATVTVSAGTAIKRVTVETWTAARDTAIQDTTVILATTANPSGTLSLGGVACGCSIAFYSGINIVTGITPLTNWTARDEHDFGANTAGSYTYDTIGTTDVTMGYTAANDHVNCIGVAIKELPAGFRSRLAGGLVV